MHDLPTLLDELQGRYGPPSRALPKTALEWVLWENAAYLVSEEKRRKAYRALKEATGLRVRVDRVEFIDGTVWEAKR